MIQMDAGWNAVSSVSSGSFHYKKPRAPVSRDVFSTFFKGIKGQNGESGTCKYRLFKFIYKASEK